MEGQTAEQVLQRLQEELNALCLHQGNTRDSLDFRIPPPSKGSGPRLFCGHVPKEATEEIVKAHFSRWGLVTDVYFPRHKKTLKRRPFCFVTFATTDAAERALAESPLNICGIPIKNLTMVEDRDKYYKEKHAAAQQALLVALQNLGATGSIPQEQVDNVAAMLAMEGLSTDELLSALLQDQHHKQGMLPGQTPSSGYPFSPPGALSSRHSIGHAPAHHHLHAIPTGTFQDYYSQDQQQQKLEHSLRVAAAGLGAHPTNLGQTQRQHTAAHYTNGMRRDASWSSLSDRSQSDWFSTTSSARNSLDVSSNSLFSQSTAGLNTGSMQSGAFPTRLSVDAALQLRQQLLAAAAGNPSAAGLGGLTQSPAFKQQQQQQQQQQSVMQSAFYQPSLSQGAPTLAPLSSPIPPPQQPQQQQQQHVQNSHALPPISESNNHQSAFSNSSFFSSLWNRTQPHQGSPSYALSPPRTHGNLAAPVPSASMCGVDATGVAAAGNLRQAYGGSPAKGGEKGIAVDQVFSF